MHTMKKFLLITLSTLLCCSSHAAEPAAVSTDAIVNLPLDAAWNLFTTDAGLKSMGYAPAKIELQLGGRISAQNAHNERIDAEIVSFEPERMLSLKRADGWSVLYFQAMGQEMTALRWVELGAPTQAQSLQPLAQAHRALFDQLIRRYAPECELCRKEREAAESASR
jgi:hypothetical protein